MSPPPKGGPDVRRAAVTAASLALLLGLAACGGGSGGGNGPGSKPLRLVIGNDLPLQGTSKALGASGQKASDLAVDEINRAIETAHADHRVRTLSEDQGSDPDAATQSAKKLVDDEGASCLTGPWSSDAVDRTAQDVAIPTKTLEITPVPTSEDVGDLNDHDLVNSTALPESVEGSALSKAIEADLGGVQGESVSVAARDDAYGDTLSQDFIKDWQDKDGTIGSQTALTPLAPNTPAQAKQITAGNPGAVLVIDGLDGFSQLAPALSSSGSWSPTIAWGSDQLVSPSLPGQVGRPVVDGMRALAPGSPQYGQTSAAFVDDFRSAAPHNVTIAPFAAQEFDATVLCYLAAVAAGSTDGQRMADHLIDITAPGGEEFSWQQLPDAIRALEEGRDIDYTGASGPIDMDVQGNPTSGVFDVYRYSGDALKVVGEVPAEKPNPATP